MNIRWTLKQHCVTVGKTEIFGLKGLKLAYVPQPPLKAKRKTCSQDQGCIDEKATTFIPKGYLELHNQLLKRLHLHLIFEQYL